MASAAATERETSRALTLLDRLDQANLTEAFRGELCAEDASEESKPEMVETVLDGGPAAGAWKRVYV